MKAAFAGISLPNNNIWPYLDEFLMRNRMAKIGFTTDFDELDDEKAQIFMQISVEIDKASDKNGKR